MSNRNIYLYTICDAAVMIAINLIGNVFPSAESTVEILLVLCPLTSIVLLLRDWKRDGSWPGEAARAGKEQPLLERKNLIGLCVVMFFFPFAYHVSIVSLFSDVSFLGRDGGDIVALVIFAFVIRATKARANLVTVYRVAIPLVLGGFLLCCLLPAQAAAANALMAGGGLKLASLFFWVLLLRAVPDGKPRWIVLASGLGAKFLGNAIALFLHFSLPSTAFDSWNDLIAMAVIIVILMGVIVWTLPGKFNVEPDEARALIDSSVSGENSLEILCAGIADEYRLTKRETEVFLLLAQGRNEGTIAEMLSVGKGTAHSHILHVYQKLGIHSQQELIAFVHGR